MHSNIFLIDFKSEDFQLERIPYAENKLEELRKTYNKTHSFFRNGDFIYISNKEDFSMEQLGEKISLNIFKDEKIVNSLLKHLFFRTFKDNFSQILPLEFSPFRFYSRQEKDDLISMHISEELKDQISYRKQIELQLRQFSFNKKRWGFTINTTHKWGLNINCKELVKKGMDVIGLDVLKTEELPGLNSIMAPNEEFIGNINEIKDNEAYVVTSDGIELIELEKLYLKKSTFNIRAFLEHIMGSDKSEEILNKVKLDLNKKLNHEKDFQEISSIAKLLFNKKGKKLLFENLNGFCFTVNDSPFSSSNTFQLKKPSFIFDPAATQVENRNPDIGLKNYGPYDSGSFDPKSPTILGICHKANRGKFANFIHRLINGMPESTWFKDGFRKKYDFHEINFDLKEVKDYKMEHYLSIISSLNVQPDIVIIEIPFEFKKLRPESNPYYQLKAQLLTLEIPVQFILNKNLVANNVDAILNAICLQIYAKLGGTPWVLPSSKSVDKELIIGIGHSIIRSSNFKGAEQNRVVGITTFFSSDGQYLLSNKAKDVSFDNYFDELLNNLKEALLTLEENQAWKNNDTIRLIFHIFKPIKNIEHQVVQELIKEFKSYNVQYAFVTISKKHPYKLYDLIQPGKKIFSGSLIGKYIPERGSNVRLNETSCLIQLLGVNEIKTSTHGASNPLLVRIRIPGENTNWNGHTEELFIDIHYIVQQIFSFTYLSWRGFLPSEQPATMLYSNLFANLLGNLRKIDSWHPNVLNFKLKRKKWFL